MKNKIRTILRQWLPLAAVAMILCGLMYATAQQVLRQGANDPQIQMAEDGAAALSRGATAESIVPLSTVDMADSLAPFLIVIDKSGKVSATSGRLHGEAPIIPGGVLDFTRMNGEDRITWQPESGVRIAAVFVHVEGEVDGFVMAGRSLREVEKREDQAEWIAGLALIVLWIGSLGAVILSQWWLADRK